MGPGGMASSDMRGDLGQTDPNDMTGNRE
jgi:hypothetical protein